MTEDLLDQGSCLDCTVMRFDSVILGFSVAVTNAPVVVLAAPAGTDVGVLFASALRRWQTPCFVVPVATAVVPEPSAVAVSFPTDAFPSPGCCLPTSAPAAVTAPSYSAPRYRHHGCLRFPFY